MSEQERNLKGNDNPSRPDSDRYIFSDQAIIALSELGEVLRRIHRRLVAEGYVIKNGTGYKREN